MRAGAEVAGSACGGTSITNGMKWDAEEAGQKVMTAVLNELLPQTPMGARTHIYRGSKEPLEAEELLAPLMIIQPGYPRLRHDNARITFT